MSADAVGGVWSYAMELAAGLSAEGVEVLLAVLGPAPGEHQRRQAQAITGLTLACGDYPLEWMPGALPAQRAAGEWLLGLARDWQPDVVHLNHYGHGHLLWPVPCLVVAHSCVLSWFEHVKGEPAGAEWQDYCEHVTRGLLTADLVIAPSAAMLADVRRLYGPLSQAKVIHNGRDARAFPPREKQPFVLAAGRLWDEAKNIRMLRYTALTVPWPVRVAGELRRPDGGCEAGEDDPLEGMQPLGVLDPAAMADAFGEASIYVLPARYEPFGLSALEAACAGCALVLSDIASLRELWDGAAEFAPADDAAAMRDTVAALISDEGLRARRARQASERATRYSAQRMTRDYLDTYAGLLGRWEPTPCAS
ncbi:glycosyltransferase family 4 protein [Dyella sp.]|uniref:glycosyltransferase family 4 protein n=1 Tax=Dyella sp. TaxID=1869338 RepID=UPI002D78553A|nr:glycosyltransferase family 4 protein [Dyella sp.]HET6433087.1 glycosyltransferase family 4 protein [Dyella sp.]